MRVLTTGCSGYLGVEMCCYFGRFGEVMFWAEIGMECGWTVSRAIVDCFQSGVRLRSGVGRGRIDAGLEVAW